MVIRGYVLIKQNAPADQVIGQFRQAADTFPSSAEAPEALLRIGYLRDKNGADPLEWQEVVDKYPKTKEAAEALHCLGHKALRDGNPASAAGLFQRSAATAEATPEQAEDSRVEAGYAFISQYWKTLDPRSLSRAIAPLLRVQVKPVKAETALSAYFAEFEQRFRNYPNSSFGEFEQLVGAQHAGRLYVRSLV